MVGNIIFNTRQIYIYRYLKCQFFTSLFARNDYHITAKPRKTRKKYFDYLAAKTTQNMQKILHHQKSTRQISMGRN